MIPPDAMTAGDGEEGDESEAVKGKAQGKDQGKGKGKKRVDDSDGNDTKKNINVAVPECFKFFDIKL